jgi:hypothetical protein
MVPRPTMSPSFARLPLRWWVTTWWAGALVVLALTLLVTSPALAATPTFTDVPATHPYYAAIGDLANRDIINGKGDGRFYPADPVTRQQFAKMVVKTLGLTVTGDEACPFVDVFPGAGTDPFYPVKYVAVCAQNNITKGADAAHFNPGANISRQQLITMVVRAAGLSGPPAEYVPSFSAGQFSLDEHYQNARKAAYAGLLDGLVGLGPNYGFAAPASRGECAQLLYNLRQQGLSGGGSDGTGSITTTPATDSVHVSVGSAGGLFDLGQPGLMEGLQLEAPAGAYSQGIGLDVSFLPITGDTFGPDIDLVSPLIHVDNGGVIADENLALTIPVQVPAGKFATASFYDKDTGTLEPLPLLDEGAAYITVATRHFSDIVVELDKLPALQGNATSFSPALDGWQFINKGTVITPGGECGGMCTAALYYFYSFVADASRSFQPRAGVARLYGRYDNTGKVSTPTFGDDDSPAIRLCSAVQYDYEGMWDASPGYFWEEFVRRDEATWKNLLVALSRHQPRLIGLTGFGPGHQVIAYDAWVGPDGNGELKVADPNYPGDVQEDLLPRWGVRSAGRVLGELPMGARRRSEFTLLVQEGGDALAGVLQQDSRQ